MDKNMKNKDFINIFLGFWIASLIFYFLLLICPYFLQNPYAIIGNSELLPEFAHKMFIFRGLSFDNMYYVGEFTNPFIISIYKILLFFVSIYSIFVLIFKTKFYRCDNKLTKAVQYMILSFSILILSIMNFYGGHLDYLSITRFGMDIKINYVIHHELIPVIIAILLILLDVPYLVKGIKDYRKNKDCNNLRFKDKLKLYILDTQNFTFIFFLSLSIIIYLLAFILNGGIEYPDPKQVIEYIWNIN